MKRIMNSSLAALTRVSVAAVVSVACASAVHAASLNVFACEPEWGSLAKTLGGDHVKVTTATTAFQDAHHIEARPSLIAKIRRADLVFCTGAELEIGWLPLLLRQSGNRNIQDGQSGNLMAADLVPLIDIPKKLDRSMGDIHGAGNPHVHLDPNRLLTIAEALGQRLQVLDPQHSADYQRNYTVFKTRWDAALARWETQNAPLKGQQVVVQHTNLKYFLNWLGMEVVADLEPVPGLPPTSGHLAKTLRDLKAQQPKLVLASAFQSRKGLDWLAKRADLPVVDLAYTVGGNEKSTDLLALYDDMLGRLLQGVSQ